MLLLLLLGIFAEVNDKNIGILATLVFYNLIKLATLVFLARHPMFKSSHSIVTMEL